MSGADSRLGKGEHYLYEHIAKTLQVSQLQAMEVLWQLLSEGLVFIDFRQSAPENWRWVLTERGHRAANSPDNYPPDDPEGYLQRLRERLPDLDERVLTYTSESLRSYGSGCFLASAVMLGVASERAFQILGESFADWLPDPESARFRSAFENARQNYVAKFSEFRKRIEPYKPELPAELGDGMALTLDSVLDLLRVTRNEAGHPTGRLVSSADAYIHLQMFARYLERIYAYREYFLSPRSGPAKGSEVR